MAPPLFSIRSNSFENSHIVSANWQTRWKVISKEQWIKDLTPASVYSNILSVSLNDPPSIYCPAPFSDLSEQ